jgi:hypothetical protein
MVNNVGKTTQTLNTNLGETTPFTTSENITILTGEIGKGLLLFDNAGTLGVISDYTNDTSFIVTTYALSIDIQTILNLSY